MTIGSPKDPLAFLYRTQRGCTEPIVCEANQRFATAMTGTRAEISRGSGLWPQANAETPGKEWGGEGRDGSLGRRAWDLNLPPHPLTARITTSVARAHATTRMSARFLSGG